MSANEIEVYNARLNFTVEQQRALVADHVTHGLPVYDSGQVPAYLLHHTHFVSAYSEQLKQPAWTAANVSLRKVTSSAGWRSLTLSKDRTA